MLAPDIVESCVDGAQSIRLTARTLLACDLSIAWPDQRKMLGFRRRSEATGFASSNRREMQRFHQRS
jgi:hypothetical protein